MRLVAFKAQGFKSFSDPVSFTIKNGVTGIVGPNGCGKSNFVDAMRWALGESRISLLRGKALQDVLFNGSANRPPADWCSVTLSFVNNGEHDLGMWSQSSEIIVRRELNREGGSFFYINGQAVRRLDVVNLFRGTGVAPRAYGVIEQGMVGRIAEASADELRAFVEEASGVSHYRHNRQNTERRLAISEENLQQVGHLSAQMEKRAASLKRQSRAAGRHQELNENINKLNALLILERINQSKHKRTILVESLTTAKLRLDETRKRFDELKEQERTARARRDELMREAGVHEEKLEDFKQAADTARRNWENTTQTRVALHTRLEAQRHEQEESRQTLESLGRQFEQRQKSYVVADSALTEETSLMAVATAQLERLRESVAPKQRLAEIAQGELSALEQKLGSDKMRKSMLSTYSESTTAVLNEKRLLLEKNEAIINLLQPSVEAEEAKLKKEKEELAAAEEKLRTNSAEMNERQKAVQEVEKRIIALDAEREALSAVRNAGGNWDTEAPLLLSHVLGVQAGEWATALDAALGVFAGSFAVDELSAFINKHGLPPKGVMLVETEAHHDVTPKLSAASGRTLLIEKLQMPEKSRTILSVWLDGVYAADDDGERPHTLHQTLVAGEMAVTKDGVLYLHNAVYVHGDLPGGYDWEQRLTTINAAVEKLRVQHNEQEAGLNTFCRRVEEAKQTQEASSYAFAKAQENIAEKRIALNQWLERRGAAITRCKELNAEIKAAIYSLSETDKEAKSLNVDVVGEQNIAAEKKAKSAESLWQAAVRDTEARQAGVHQHELKRRELEAYLEGDKQRERDLKARMAGSESRIATLDKRIQQNIMEVEACNEQDLQEKYEACERQSENAVALVRKYRVQAQDDDTAAGEAVALRESCYENMQAAQKEINEYQLKDRELAVTIDGMNDSLEDFAVSQEQLHKLAEEKADSTAAQWQIEIEELQAKRQRLGAINFAADSELSECENVLQEQEIQRRDIAEAVAELRASMENMDKEMRQRMTTMLAKLNTEFGVLFKRFFNGGDARLEMDGDSILDSGFEICARPPGKRLLSARALSGGEKAVTALAFIFSLLRLNPPPFCIMDEVDAPLDEKHTINFISLLKEMAEDFQCLLITHNKSTLEHMRHLIGVTQEEKGVSKIVSVSLTEAMQQAAAADG